MLIGLREMPGNLVAGAKGDPEGAASIASSYLNARLPEQIGLFT